jgi:hypothetical protein
MHKLVLTIVALTMAGWAQTQVGLRTQSKDVDFGAAASTRPFKTGTSLPSTCGVGEVFYNTNAAAGQNIFACVSANTWLVEGGGNVSTNIPNQLVRGQAITGSQDEVQLDIAGNSSQSNPVFRVRTSSGANLIQANNDGSVTLGSGNGPEVTTNQTTPSAPPAPGVSFRWIDSTDRVEKVMDDAGRVSVGVRPESPSCASQGKVVADIGSDGVVTCGSAPHEIELRAARCSGTSTAQLLGDTPPAGATAATAGGCSGTNVNDAYAVFSNSGTPSLQFSITLPPDIATTASVYVNYLTGTASGTWTPALDLTCVATGGSATNDPAWTANNFFAPGSTTAPSTASALATVSATGLILPVGCTAGNRAHLRLIRKDTTGTAVNIQVAEVIVVL